MARIKAVIDADGKFSRRANTVAENKEADAREIIAVDYEANHKYKDDRRVAYAAIGDQLDNITKVLKILKAGGVDVGSDGDAQIEMSDAVKAAHPKP
jgi:hypothetical protein